MRLRRAVIRHVPVRAHRHAPLRVLNSTVRVRRAEEQLTPRAVAQEDGGQVVDAVFRRLFRGSRRVVFCFLFGFVTVSPPCIIAAAFAERAQSVDGFVVQRVRELDVVLGERFVRRGFQLEKRSQRFFVVEPVRRRRARRSRSICRSVYVSESRRCARNERVRDHVTPRLQGSRLVVRVVVVERARRENIWNPAGTRTVARRGAPRLRPRQRPRVRQNVVHADRRARWARRNGRVLRGPDRGPRRGARRRPRRRIRHRHTRRLGDAHAPALGRLDVGATRELSLRGLEPALELGATAALRPPPAQTRVERVLGGHGVRGECGEIDATALSSGRFRCDETKEAKRFLNWGEFFPSYTRASG